MKNKRLKTPIGKNLLTLRHRMKMTQGEFSQMFLQDEEGKPLLSVAKLSNLENRGNDPFFKKKFLEEGDPAVTEILEGYAALEPKSGAKETSAQCPEGMAECPKEALCLPWERLERIAEELLETAKWMKEGKEKNREKEGI